VSVAVGVVDMNVQGVVLACEREADRDMVPQSDRDMRIRYEFNTPRHYLELHQADVLL
jgi:hypothetical protein